MDETISTVQLSDLMLAIVVVTLAIALFVAVAFYVKNYNRHGLINHRFRPKRRLSILETVQVDRKRKLVLMSKDGEEFLMLMGGPSDVLVAGHPSLDAALTNSALGNSASGNASSDQTQMAFENANRAFEPRSMETSTDRLIVASNDEAVEQRQQPPPGAFVQNEGASHRAYDHRAHDLAQRPFDQEPVANRPIAPGNGAQHTNTYATTGAHQLGDIPPSHASDHAYPSHHGHDEELEHLLEEALAAPTIDEEVVAEAVNMLTSEEEVTAFFDRTRSRVFEGAPQANHKRTGQQRTNQPRNGQQRANQQSTGQQRDDTDDFSAVLRSQQGARSAPAAQKSKPVAELGRAPQRKSPQTNGLADTDLNLPPQPTQPYMAPQMRLNPNLQGHIAEQAARPGHVNRPEHVDRPEQANNHVQAAPSRDQTYHDDAMDIPLRAEPREAPREAIREAPSEGRREARRADRPPPPTPQLSDNARMAAERNARDAAARARKNASVSLQIQPIPETAEERIAKLKSLLSAHNRPS